MADSSKRGFDCEGEGERGKRGKRGHRGHRGSVGPIGPTGPAANAVPTQAYDPTITTIFARPDGSDEDGDGTADNPFATFQRAIRQVPSILPSGSRWIVDITGIGTELLPVNYAVPSIACPNYRFKRDFTLPWFQMAQQVTVRANPQLLSSLAPADAIITAAQATSPTAVASSPATQLVTLTIDTPRAAWAGDALKGKQLIRTVSVFPFNFGTGGTPGVASAAIYASTATQLFLTVDSGAFNNGDGPLFMAPGEQLQIVEPSATLLSPPADPDFATSVFDPFFDPAPAFTCVDVGSIGFQGIAFKCTSPGSAPSLCIGGHSPSLELCTVDWLLAVESGDGTFMLGGNVFTTALDFEHNSSAFIFSSLCLNVSSFFFSIGTQMELFNVVCDGCATVGNQAGEPPILGGFGIFNALFVNGTSDPAIAVSPGHGSLKNVQLNNNPGDAIQISNGGFAACFNVTGSGNGGYGVHCTGAGSGTAQVDAATTIGNADGRAYINGNNAPVAAWPGVPFNDTDPTTFSRVFELP